MNMKTSIITCLKKCITINGRASRSEYWWFVLFYAIITFLLLIINAHLLSSLWGLMIALPLLCVSVRRLHDINKSGWILLFYPILIIPAVLLGGLIIIEAIQYYGSYNLQKLQSLWTPLIISISSIIVYIFFAVLYCKKGTEGVNRFGEDPLASDS